MAEILPVVVGDPGATKVKPVLLVDALGNPIDATHQVATTLYASNVALIAGVNNADAIAVTGTLNKLTTIGYGYQFNGTSWDRWRKANAVSRLMSSAATTNATSAKASAGDLKKITGLKATAANCFLKLYNKASAPTVGTDTPVIVLPLIASQPFNFDFGEGFYFSTGIAWAITALATDADTTAIAVGDVLALTIMYA
ncbi:hypothetical protein [Mesorhizobium sp. M4B.F.Ca.ET.017.02.2.1]|uniref:hypothetical protein n=1 Tax=Mesorhizobium sp. M4B.F.Ca.ET.017.02.2.1 TaxID=2496649 RepID=UPI000FCB1CA1|nr:hypothetical protein [Mesorhizobium sp. M4B.F.Ca.ET.017.02.2.1]RVD31425.1 hypothetical protein EN738_01855 [Mesorhizobium sp. M4B.F.Ca.ET.017.02.2.1]